MSKMETKIPDWGWVRKKLLVSQQAARVAFVKSFTDPLLICLQRRWLQRLPQRTEDSLDQSSLSLQYYPYLMLNHFNGEGNVALLAEQTGSGGHVHKRLKSTEISSTVPEDEPVALHCGASLPVFSCFPVLSCFWSKQQSWYNAVFQVKPFCREFQCLLSSIIYSGFAVANNVWICTI